MYADDTSLTSGDTGVRYLESRFNADLANLKASFHIIADYRRIAEIIEAKDR